MARGRMLNKKISMSAQMHRLPNDTCRLFATWLIAHLDIRGTFHADPQLVKSLVFPRRDDVTCDIVRGYLEAIAQEGLVVRFEANGEEWLYWPGFSRNQVGIRYDRELPEFPPPPGWTQPDDETGQPEEIRQDAGKLPAEVKGSKVKKSEKKLSVGADAPPSPPRHPAIDVYRTKALRFPDKAQWPSIEKDVDTDDASLDFWGKVVEGYILLGWNKLNVGGMLEFYNRHEIPARKSYNGNGAQSSEQSATSKAQAAIAISRQRAAERAK